MKSLSSCRVRAGISAAKPRSTALIVEKSFFSGFSASGLARSALVATPRMSDGRGPPGSGIDPEAWRSQPACSDRFIELSWDVTTIQHGAVILRALTADSCQPCQTLRWSPADLTLVAAAGNVLANFVNDEDKGLAFPPSPPELKCAFHDLADRDGRVPLRWACETIESAVIELQNGGHGTQSWLGPETVFQSFFRSVLQVVGGYELGQLAFTWTRFPVPRCRSLPSRPSSRKSTVYISRQCGRVTLRVSALFHSSRMTQ